MSFNTEELSLISRALVDTAGRLKERLGRMCEADPSYPNLYKEYNCMTLLAKRTMVETWKKIEAEDLKKNTVHDETGDCEAT